MKFLLTLHQFNMLNGRGYSLVCYKCKLAIQVKVKCTCMTCGFISEIIGEWDDKDYKLIICCEKCKSENCKVEYLQYVESKHRRGNHYFYHWECWDSLFYGDCVRCFA